VIPDLHTLNIRGCPLIKNIPVLPRLAQLWAGHCPLLATIPELPRLRVLGCWDCPLLASLPVLPSLMILESNKCPALKSLPVLPELTRLTCDSWINHRLNDRLPAVQRIARTLVRRRLKKLRYVRFKKFISTPVYSAYLNAPGHVGHRIETAQLRKLGSERT